MTQVSLIVKDTHGKFSENNNVAISQGDSTTIIIKSNETVKIEINPSEIASVTQEGNNVVFHLKDGTKVIVENFYLAENPQIILQNGQKYWEAKLTSEAEGNIFVEYVELTELPHMVSDTTSIYAWILGGLAGAGLVALITDKDRIDTTPPEPGVSQLQNYTDTGISSTDQITQDKDFTLAVTGQETGTTIRYLVSKDAGQTWQETTASQTDLADGTYQFKAVVTDTAGNSSETAIQQIIIDTTAPSAGVLSLVDLSDTGISSTDQITQDKSFTLAVTGQETGTTIRYLVSKDAGQTWQETIASQTDLADGTYQFKAVVTDTAGNSSETVIQQIIIDTTAPSAGVLNLVDLSDTGISSTDQITQDKSFALAVTGQETGTTIRYLVSKDAGQTWQETTTSQTDLADGTYQFKAVVTDAAGNSSETAIQQIIIDTTAPSAGVLSLVDLSDTGISSTDQITQDKSLTLAVTGQETGTTIRYLVSKDAGQTWQETTARQTDLADGTYQFKAVVTDAAGNSSETAIQQLMVDNIAPPQANLVLINFDDTGSSLEDKISLDNSFNLSIANSIVIGAEVALLDHFEVSIDGGLTWNETTVNQNDLVDGSYLYKAIVTDLAGNKTESAIQKVIVDRNLELLNNSFKIELFTEDNTISLLEKEQLIPIRISLNSLPEDIDQTLTKVSTLLGETTVNFVFDAIQQDWVAEVSTSNLWSDQQQNSLTIDINITDIAGNTTTLQKVHTYQLNHQPSAPILLESKNSLLEGVVISGTAFKGSTIDLYKADGTWLADTVVDEDGYFTIQTELSDLDQEIYVTSNYEGYVSEPSLHSKITEVPSLNIISISQSGMITGLATASSTIYVKDINGNLIQAFSLNDSNNILLNSLDGIDLGSIQSFSLQLDQQLPEGTEIVITAEKDGTLGFSHTITTDYTPADFLETPKFDQNGDFLSVLVSEPNTWILVIAESGQVIGAGYTDENGFIEVEIWQTLKEGELVTVVTRDGNHNIKELVIEAPNFAYAPEVHHISQNGLMNGYAEAGSTIYVKDFEGVIIGETTVYSEYEWLDFVEFSLSVNRTLNEGEELSVYLVDSKGVTSAETLIQVDFTAPLAPENLSFNADGDWIYGTAEPYAEITVKNSEGYILNQWSWSNWANQEGKFAIELSKFLTDADIIYVTATDSNGNESSITELVAPDYAFAPIIENLSNSGVFSGYAENNSTLIIKDINGLIIAETAIFDGNDWNEIAYFNFTLERPLIDGEVFHLSIQDERGQISKETVVVADVSAPNVIENIVFNQNGQNFTGTAEVQSYIEVFDINANQVGWGNVDALGNVSGHFYQTYLNGEELTFVVIDRAGNRSLEYKQTALNDDVAPNPIENLILNENGQGFTASIEADSRVEVFDTEGNQVGWGYADNLGNVSGYFYQTYLKGEELTFVVIDRAGNRSTEVKQIALIDDIAPNAIENLILNEDGRRFTASVEAESRVEVFNTDGNQVGLGYADSLGNVSGVFYQTYLKGEVLTFVVIDRAGNRSPEVKQIALIDDIAPNAIENMILNEDGQGFTASVEADSRVEVFNTEGNQVGWGYADSLGNVSGMFYQTYLNGEELTFVVIDRAGNRSVEVKQTALNDDTAPNAIENIVFNENGQNFIGTAEANSNIAVFDAEGSQVGWGHTDSSGNVSGYLNQIFLKGEELTFVVIDRAGNRSVEVKQTALNDDIAPIAIENLILNEDGRSFTAIAEAESRIEVFDIDGNLIGLGYADSLGNASGTFYQTYFKGQELTFVVIDRAGNRSIEVKQTALNDDIAPNAIENIIFNEDGQNFTGVAEEESRIEVFDTNGNLVGWGGTDSSGNVSGYLNQIFLKGQELTFVVIDRAGNRSPEVKQTALNDDIAPNAIENIIFNEDGRSFTASAEIGSRIEIYDTDGSQVGWGYVDSLGDVSGYFYRTYLSGEELTFVVIDRAGNRSVEVKQTALDDDVAPLAVKNLTITSEGIISGEAEPNSTVEITDQYGAFIATTYVAYDGTFSQSINLSQYQNQNISLIVKDLAGNRSEIVSEQLPEFTNSPNPATDLKLDAEGHVLMGIATAGMTLIVTKSDGELINGWWYNTVNDDGSFNISLNDYYLQGQTLQVRVFDPNTNLYSLVTEIIAPLDNIAPIIDEAVISEDGYTITGQVDSKAIIKVVDADGNLRAEYQTDENGYFILSIYPPVLRGEQLFITATDLAKNISAPFNIDFHADINAPQSVENVVVADNGFFIEGHAVPNSYIYIVDVQSNYIANGYVNESGYFNIQFYPPQASGQTLRIVVEQNGYQSAYTEIMVPVDTVAPNAPTELSLKDGNLLSGQAEAYSTVKIFDENNNQVGQAITDSNGIFSTWLSSQFWHGETLTVNVVDINQNVSSSATIIATTDVTAPDTVTQLAINEWGSLIGQAESNATVEITYYFDDQLPSLTSTMAWVDGTFSCYIYENATSVSLTVVDRAGNRSEKITQTLNDLPKITVDQFKGDATDNTYVVDHTNDFIQEYTVVPHDVFQDIWMDTSHYEEQWVVSGYSNYLWVESGYYEDIWIDTSYYEDVWVDTSFYQDVWIVDGTRDVYTDLNGLNYYSNDGSYDAYLSNYYDYNLNQWQSGYELSGPYVEELGHYEQQLVQDGYYESKWIEQGHYEQQYVNDGYFEEVWIDTSDYQNVWVESGYWETQIVGVDYTDVDLGGNDKIISSVSYSLSGFYEFISDVETSDSYLESGRYVEDLELVGSAHLYATGNALDNLLTGNAGNNVLNGKEGNDTYLGADGSDKIIFHLLNYYDTTGGNGQDTVLDFYLGDVKVDAQADQIDLSNLFVSSALDETTVVDFIDVKQENGNSIISIDLDGVDSTYESTPLLTLLQTNTTLDELLNNQQIVLFN
ncbi:Ig-like domain-containing protein [Acinetobacter junii]|uniref:Ig-like domain-containing protein n=1 Tax=Acinetobacter junii TaxID=40215 RepID=UPI003215C3A6